MRFCQIRAVVTTGGEWHVFPFHALCSYHGGRSLLRLKKIEFRLRHWCFYLLWIYKIWLRYVPSPSDQIFLPCSICPPLKSASNQIRSVWRTLYGPFNTHSLPSIRLTLASVHVGGFYFIPFHQKFLFWDVGLRWIVEFHQFWEDLGFYSWLHHITAPSRCNWQDGPTWWYRTYLEMILLKSLCCFKPLQTMLQTVFRASLANKWIFLAKIRQRDCYFIYNQCLDWASRKFSRALLSHYCCGLKLYTIYRFYSYRPRQHWVSTREFSGQRGLHYVESRSLNSEKRLKFTLTQTSLFSWYALYSSTNHPRHHQSEHLINYHQAWFRHHHPPFSFLRRAFISRWI